MKSTRRPVTWMAAACFAAVPLLPAQSPDLTDVAQRTGAAEPNGGDDVLVLPKGMLPAPAGTVRLGREAKELLEVLADLHRTESQKLDDAKWMMRELGVKTVDVAPFLMSKYPVTKRQYAVFVEKTGHRPPFDWWRFGMEEEYQKTLARIREETGKEVDPVLYWQQNYKDLPFAIPKTPAGESTEDFPVIYVSWRDAVAYAAWAGMRLPTEAEWVWAATADKDLEFLWGDEFQPCPVEGRKYQVEGPVTNLDENTAGPFGHHGMVLGVWEWTNDLGFFPHVDARTYEAERAKFLRDSLFRKSDDKKVQEVVNFVPRWIGDSVVCKGGMTGVAQKMTMRIQMRQPLETIQTVGGAGFRVAKSQQPAFDIAASLLKLDYDQSYFGDRAPNLQDQAGIERYELSDDGELILGYHALSFVPLSFVSEDPRANLNAIHQQTVEDHRPVLLGTLVTTVKIAEPELEPGIYTLCYRHGGAPKELARAVAEGRKALKAAEKAKQSGREAPSDDGTYMKVLRRYGLDEADLDGDVDYVRFLPGGLTVPMNQNSLLLRNAQGDYVKAWKAPAALVKRSGRYEAGDATVTVKTEKTEKDGSEIVTFDFAVPTDQRGRSGTYGMELVLKLPKESAGGEAWRR